MDCPIITRDNNYIHSFILFGLASPSISSMGYYPMNDTCAGNQVQQKCAASGHGRRGAGIRDKDSLRKARDAISDNKEYWIGIS